MRCAAADLGPGMRMAARLCAVGSGHGAANGASSWCLSSRMPGGDAIRPGRATLFDADPGPRALIAVFLDTDGTSVDRFARTQLDGGAG
jgi:hypothetical protein